MGLSGAAVGACLLLDVLRHDQIDRAARQFARFGRRHADVLIPGQAATVAAQPVGPFGCGDGADQAPTRRGELRLESSDLLVAGALPDIDGTLDELGCAGRRMQLLIRGLVDAVGIAQRGKVGGHLLQHLLTRAGLQRLRLLVATVELQDALTGTILGGVVGRFEIAKKRLEALGRLARGLVGLLAFELRASLDESPLIRVLIRAPRGALFWWFRSGRGWRWLGRLGRTR